MPQCIVIEFIITCFKWNKRNRERSKAGEINGGVDPAKTNDQEYKELHEKYFGDAAKESTKEGALAFAEGKAQNNDSVVRGEGMVKQSCRGEGAGKNQTDGNGG